MGMLFAFSRKPDEIMKNTLAMAAKRNPTEYLHHHTINHERTLSE
jgi:hypothetical protein